MDEQSSDYYIDTETGLLVMTANYLTKRGYCCGNKCRHCPYIPKHTEGTTELCETEEK